jgi:integrase
MTDMMKIPGDVGEVLKAYTSKHLRWAAASTVKQYAVTLRNMAKFLGRPAVLEDFTDDLVQDMMAWFLRRGRTPRGANKVRSNIHTLWAFACRMGWMAKWPDSKRLKEPERIPTAWTRDELRSLFEALQLLPGDISGVPAGLWWTTLHSLIWDTAERIGAVIQLEWNDVSLSTGRVTFRAENRKNKLRDRQHQLHPDTVSLLTRMRIPKATLVFPWDLDKTYIWLKYKMILRKAGLPCDRAHSFHCMRKSSASYFEASGGNATELLDHSSRAVTVKHYLDISVTGTKNPAPKDVLFRPAG